MAKTTYEMDGLLTQEHIDNRNTIVLQCRLCKKWTIHRDYLINRKHPPCINCGDISYDTASIKSLRSYNPLTDNKRKIKK